MVVIVTGCTLFVTSQYAGLSMKHIYLSHYHPLAIYACPISSHPMGRFPWDSHGMTFPWTSLGLSMRHIYLSHCHPIAIYVCPIPWDVSHGIPIGMTSPWTSLPIRRHIHVCKSTFWRSLLTQNAYYSTPTLLNRCTMRHGNEQLSALQFRRPGQRQHSTLIVHNCKNIRPRAKTGE